MCVWRDWFIFDVYCSSGHSCFSFSYIVGPFSKQTVDSLHGGCFRTKREIQCNSETFVEKMFHSWSKPPFLDCVTFWCCRPRNIVPGPLHLETFNTFTLVFLRIMQLDWTFVALLRHFGTTLIHHRRMVERAMVWLPHSSISRCHSIDSVLDTQTCCFVCDSPYCHKISQLMGVH